MIMIAECSEQFSKLIYRDFSHVKHYIPKGAENDRSHLKLILSFIMYNRVHIYASIMLAALPCKLNLKHIFFEKRVLIVINQRIIFRCEYFVNLKHILMTRLDWDFIFVLPLLAHPYFYFWWIMPTLQTKRGFFL